jgi:2-phospho-L-lactate guanylyltransferase
MGTLAILPVKSFDGAKQRLGDGLDAGPRRALAEAMFSDVIVALRRARAVHGILVVTSDTAAQQIAAGHGANVLEEPDEGHNAAAAAGIRVALEAGEDRALLVPGDCPLLDPRELDGLIAHPARGRSALIVPDRHGTGTNALLLTPPDSLAPAFGPGSCERHVANARQAGTTPEVVGIPTLALDVDTPEDLEALQAALGERHGGAAHTRGMLRQLLRSRS